ncbi:hypothetical protein SNQ36_001711 [Cronobacter sakazakii]|nr:hypothetical protein [Cronobacter sakazakii]
MFSFSANTVKNDFSACNEIINKKYRKGYLAVKNNISSHDSLKDDELLCWVYFSAWKHLEQAMQTPKQLDDQTPFNRKHVGEQIFDKNTVASDPKYHLSILLRFMWEYCLSVNGPFFPLDKPHMDGENLTRLDKADEAIWGEEVYFLTPPFTWVKDIMPYEIYRDFLSDPRLQEAKILIENVENEKLKLEGSVQKIINSATSSVEYLEAVKEQAEDLGKRLTDIKREGNFKLLAKAFSTLRINKNKEVVYAQFRMWLFIVFLIALPVSVFKHAYYAGQINVSISGLLIYVPLISLELLFFYFMRLFYVEVKSLKSQLVQIDLRLNLCEFIYDYVETRDKTHSDKVSESWKAFEALIFSPIQPNEDKIPSVMDGTDVLADLAGKILKAKGN